MRRAKRFELYAERELKTGLKFSLWFHLAGGRKIVSILEEDVFTIEPIFYRFFPGYSNFGHWGVSTVEPQEREQFLAAIAEYIVALQTRQERRYWDRLTETNFGLVYGDIEANRDRVVALAQQLHDLILSEERCKIDIEGV
jgi:hypothetical protein